MCIDTNVHKMHQRYRHTETHTHIHPRTSDAPFGRELHTRIHTQSKRADEERGRTWSLVGGRVRREMVSQVGMGGSWRGDGAEDREMKQRARLGGKAAEWEAKCPEHIQL